MLVRDYKLWIHLGSFTKLLATETSFSMLASTDATNPTPKLESYLNQQIVDTIIIVSYPIEFWLKCLIGRKFHFLNFFLMNE